MKRRTFLKSIGLGGLVAASPLSARILIPSAETGEWGKIGSGPGPHQGKARVVTMYDMMRDKYIGRLDVLCDNRTRQMGVDFIYTNECDFEAASEPAIHVLKNAITGPFEAPFLFDLEGYYLTI